LRVNKKRVRRIVMLCGMLGAAASARAYVEETANPLILGPMGSSLSGLFPVEPLAKGQSQINVAGLYYTATESHNSLNDDGFFLDKKYSGGGGSVSWIYGLSEHWSVSAVGAYAAGTNDFTVSAGGSSFPISNLVAGNPLMHGTGTDSGGMGAVTAAYDPTSPEGRFKFPMIAGLVYVNSTASAQTPFTITQGPFAGQSATKTEQTKVSGPAPVLGFAPEFDAWTFRLMPFFYAVLPIGASSNYTGQVTANGRLVQASNGTNATGGSGTSDSFHGIVDLGARVIYRPWGLGLTWIPAIYFPLAGARIQLYSLTWSRRL
jgi:hypothetical protein